MHRFLKQEQAVGAWYEVDEEVAREKASQCLRDIVAALTKGKVNSGINLNMLTHADSTSMLSSASTPSLHSWSAQQGHGSTTSTTTVACIFGRPTSMMTCAAASSCQQFPNLHATSDAAQAGLALLRGSRSSMNVGTMANATAAGNNATWNNGGSNNNSIHSVNHSMSNLRASMISSGTSAAARAGLALLHGTGSSTITSSRVVSTNSSAINFQQGSTDNAEFNDDGNNAMQMSSANLQDLNNNNSCSGGINTVKYVGEPCISEASDFNDRKRHFVSAPNLGDISTFLAKRRRNHPGDGGSRMQNATFSNPEEDLLEPVEEFHGFQRSKAASCVTLGGKSASCVALGSVLRTHDPSSGGGYKNTDALRRRLQMLQSVYQSNKVGSPADESTAKFSFVDNKNNVMGEDSTNDMGNFTWNSVGPQRTGRPNMFANLTKLSRTRTESTTIKEHNCFTGMGAVIGADDDAALRRWIDRMAEEELS